jgi:hypothetical protein
MEAFKDQFDYAKLRYQMCLFNFLAFEEDIEEAKMALKKLEEMLIEMDGSMKASLSTAKFCFYLKLDDYSMCKKVLEEMKAGRSYQPRANYNYCKSLLQFVAEDKPLYFEQSVFQEHDYLLYQLMVIKSLNLSDHGQAELYWNKLRLLSPELYKNKFHFTGDKCIFSEALKKVLHNASTLPSLNIPPGMTKFERAEYVLKHSKGKIPFEDFFYLVWEREMTSIQDRNAFLQVISRLRKKGMEISFKNNCYSLEKKSA